MNSTFQWPSYQNADADRVFVIILAAVATAVFVAVCLAFYAWHQRRNRRNEQERIQVLREANQRLHRELKQVRQATAAATVRLEKVEAQLASLGQIISTRSSGPQPAPANETLIQIFQSGKETEKTESAQSTTREQAPVQASDDVKPIAPAIFRPEVEVEAEAEAEAELGVELGSEADPNAETEAVVNLKAAAIAADHHDYELDAPDDLTLIWGIGAGNQQRLQENGVFYFEQIADWTDADVDRFNERLSFKGRIEREDWVAQARKYRDQKRIRRAA